MGKPRQGTLLAIPISHTSLGGITIISQAFDQGKPLMIDIELYSFYSSIKC
jgi:hypothetical protein